MQKPHWCIVFLMSKPDTLRFGGARKFGKKISHQQAETNSNAKGMSTLNSSQRKD